MKALKRKWLTYTVCGLVLIGAGLSMGIDAGFYKMHSPTDLNWVAYGTLALIIFNSGICFFGQGVIFRVQMLKE